MGKKKACKIDKRITDKDICPVCKKDSFTENWKGRIIFLNAEESFIAKQMNIEDDGEYALKIR